ncbi:transposase [Natronocalculus amylovorans]|uniref:Transposase n=1 Tax=Natronocalculus amylovorans TaxID=2917812 RepID=A0AAE3K7E5_9EURY|nr:transposase [Natronocalculus amylovorans]MCL9815365.1 transposase [Natronocalculus amylovorans]
MGIEEVTKTTRTRLCIESGERSWLKDARFTARDIANDTLRLKQDGYNKTDIQREVDRNDFLRNNKCAVVGKALQAWGSYKELLNWWHDQDDTNVGKPSPPATDKKGAYPLVMAHTEGYRLTYNDETDRIRFRVSPKPYKKVKGHLRGRPEDLNLIESALADDEWSLGQAELLSRKSKIFDESSKCHGTSRYRDGVYYLHVTVKTEVEVSEPEDADTLVGVDINERNITLTALNRETMDTLGTLVLDYGSVKAERQRYHTITKRCQEHGQHSIHHQLGEKEERYTEWILHRLSRVVVEFAQQFSNPVIVFEDLTGIRDAIKYGTYMNRRLHKLPFHKFEKQVRYKATWNQIPCETVGSPYNSKSCSCCGHRGYRQGRRFRCTNDSCAVQQDHADRNASVNVAWRAWAKHAGVDVESVNYRTRKTQPFVRKVSLSGSGRSVNRPSSSREIALRGVLTT